MIQLENTPLSRCVTLLSRSCHGPMTKLYEDWSMTELYEEWPMTGPYCNRRLLPYYVCVEIVYDRPTDRPTVDIVSRSVTLPWKGYVDVSSAAETRGITVSRHAESIGEGPDL